MQPTTAIEETRDGILLSTDPALVDVSAVQAFLTHSYWAKGIPLETVARSIENSLCFGLYDGKQQIGFARLVTDCATHARLADVYVLESHRGRGLGKWLVGATVAHPALRGLKSISLATRDAHDLYRRFGFEKVRHTETEMVKSHPVQGSQGSGASGAQAVSSANSA